MKYTLTFKSTGAPRRCLDRIDSSGSLRPAVVPVIFGIFTR